MAPSSRSRETTREPKLSAENLYRSAQRVKMVCTLHSRVAFGFRCGVVQLVRGRAESSKSSKPFLSPLKRLASFENFSSNCGNSSFSLDSVILISKLKKFYYYILLLSPYLHLIFIVFSNFSKRIAKFGKSNVKVTKIILERFGKRERKEPPFINHPHTYTSGKPNTSRSNPPPPDNRAAGFALKLQRSSSARRQKQWHFAVAKTEKENR